MILDCLRSSQPISDLLLRTAFMASWLVFSERQLPYMMITILAIKVFDRKIVAWELTLATLAIVTHPVIYSLVSSPDLRLPTSTYFTADNALKCFCMSVVQQFVVLPYIYLMCFLALRYGSHPRPSRWGQMAPGQSPTQAHPMPVLPIAHIQPETPQPAPRKSVEPQQEDQMAEPEPVYYDDSE